MPSRARMKTYSISQIAAPAVFRAARCCSTTAWGCCGPRAEQAQGTEFTVIKDLNSLTRIRQLREAGLSLKEIRSVLATGGTPGTRLLEQRMQKTAEDIVSLKNQQRLLAGMLRKVASGKRPRCVDKQMWIEMLKAAGMDQSAMARWHTEFENRSPDGHQEFLLSLGIPPSEAARIRSLSRGEPEYFDHAKVKHSPMRTPFSFPLILLLLSPSDLSRAGKPGATGSVVRILKPAGRYQLERNGQPYFVKGAVVGPGGSLDMCGRRERTPSAHMPGCSTRPNAKDSRRWWACLWAIHVRALITQTRTKLKRSSAVRGTLCGNIGIIRRCCSGILGTNRKSTPLRHSASRSGRRRTAWRKWRSRRTQITQ